MFNSINSLFWCLLVERQADQIKVLKPGMSIEVRHVKKKDLSQYVPAHLIKKDKKVSFGLL